MTAAVSSLKGHHLEETLGLLDVTPEGKTRATDWKS